MHIVHIINIIILLWTYQILNSNNIYLSKVGYSANKQRNIEKIIELVLNKGSSTNITSYEDLFFQEVQKQGYTPEKLSF